MNTQQFHELDFWNKLIQEEGTGFYMRRLADYKRHHEMFKGQIDLHGNGLEMGTGCFSMLEYSNADSVIGIDPLADEYAKILTTPNKKVDVRNLDGENTGLPDNKFDWIACWNVIDHTPNPMAMASEIFRLLKRGGKLYFNVNFDDKLSPAHFSLWNKGKVDYCLQDFIEIWHEETRNEPDCQSWYYAIYQKP